MVITSEELIQRPLVSVLRRSDERLHLFIASELSREPLLYGLALGGHLK